MSDTVYTGLDAGSTKCHIVGMTKDKQVRIDRQFETGEKNVINQVESIDGTVRVHLETSELSGWLSSVLEEHVQEVVVGDPRKNAWIANDPLKNDRVDAFKLANLLRMDQVHPVFNGAGQARRTLKKLVKHYKTMTKEQSRIKHQIKSRYRGEGVITSGKKVYSKKHREQFLDQLDNTSIRNSLIQLYAMLDEAVQQKQEAKRIMWENAQQFPEIHRFLEVPGVGKVVACVFSGYIQTPHRFASKQKIWRYCGLGITDRTSDGKQLSRKRIDRSTGNRHLKQASMKAYQAAMRCTETNRFQRTARRLRRKTGSKTKARLTTQRKIVEILWRMWKDKTEYYDKAGQVH